MTEHRPLVTPLRMGAASVPLVAVGFVLAGVVSVPAVHAQEASPLARVEALDLETAKIGRVTVYFAAADREHAERLAALSEEAAAYFESEFGTSFPLHLAVLDPGDWFDPWSSGEPAAYGNPWAWLQDALMGVPASMDEGRLIWGSDHDANLRRVQFVMLHEFGHIANKRYLHPEGPRPYSSVRWFEEFLADYFAYAFIHSSYPEWAETSRREWLGFIEGYTPPVLSLDWTFPDLPPEERGRTYRWHHFLLNLRAASVHEEHGLDFLRQVRDQMVWDEAGEWTTESVLSSLEEFAPGFEAWAEDLENGDYQAALSAGPVIPVPRAEANDNRSPAGVRRDGALEIALVVTEARWYPEADSGPSEVVQAFAEEGEPPRIPGPLIRVPAGTEIRARVRNALSEDRVTLYGFHTRPGSPDDSLHIDPGASRQVSFVAGDPGTYFYWGTTTGLAFDPEHPRNEDSQLHGALVVDPPGATGPPRDRVFVIGAWKEPADSAGPPPIVSRDVMTINGKSWPHTERIHLAAGDTVRWRWLNPSDAAHPMHLHGFFYRVNSRGTWAADTLYRAAQSRLAVTELMLPGGTMTMEWVPEEPGNWLFHCHFSFHVSHFLSLEKVPDPADPLGPEAPDHTVDGMRGLILGITVEPGRSGERRPEVYGGEARRIRLLVQSAPGRHGEYEGLGYVVHEEGPAPPPDSVPTMSPPLVLRRGEPVNITVVNRLRAPTGVHWHGMELPSYPDGVPGWSGTPGRLAPPIAPGDSFVAAFTPPRAGTFIYHSHSNEWAQIASGLYGPLVVVDPEEDYDPERERIFVVGGNGWVDFQGRVNGRLEPDTVRLTAGRTYRLRLININPDWRVYLSLKEGNEPLEWRALAKDGADLPLGQALRGRARILMGPGETADFAFTPERASELVFEVATQLEGWTVRVPIRVSDPSASPMGVVEPSEER